MEPDALASQYAPLHLARLRLRKEQAGHGDFTQDVLGQVEGGCSCWPLVLPPWTLSCPQPWSLPGLAMGFSRQGGGTLVVMASTERHSRYCATWPQGSEQLSDFTHLFGKRGHFETVAMTAGQSLRLPASPMAICPSPMQSAISLLELRGPFRAPFQGAFRGQSTRSPWSPGVQRALPCPA